MSPELAGRSALVTGASHGLGFAIARAYLDAGASVFLCAREETPLENAWRELATAHGEDRVAAAAGDISLPDDVDRIVTRALETFAPIQVLVNNAGIQGPIGRIDDVDWDEWEYTVRVNLLGSVLCCRAILPHFVANGYGKIVQLSGGGATSPRPLFGAYAASKAAIVRFIETLAEEVREMGIDANSVAPGALNTRLLEQIVHAGAGRLDERIYESTVETLRQGGTPLELAARLVVFLGSAVSDGISGKIISAPWDPWKTLAERKHDLASSDVYTLRRIVPADRGLDWGASETASGGDTT